MPQPPSLRDFDYFGDETPPPGVPAPPQSPDVEPAPPASLNARNLLTLATTLVFLAVGVAFAAGHADAALYAFSSAREPLMLGDVTDLTPEQIPANAFVTVHGITEHRGLRQASMRGIVPAKQDFWYFRLLGSRGVFIEVDPDPARYGFTTEVTVSGRAVDPRTASAYAQLLASYATIFATENRDEMRVIQVGLRPGEGRAAYVLAALIIGGLGMVNVWAAIRLLRTRI